MNTQSNLPELTLRGVILGAILTIILTASNVYLGLKVGLTFSTSIPAAVISMALLGMLKGSNILENNMVQTQASAAGTLSSVIFVVPGLFMVGYWTVFPLWETFMLCLCGGVLGVIFTIPLRRAMVVQSTLTYPEGRAAAEILKIGNGESRAGAKELGLGTLLASVVSFITGGLKLASDGGQISFLMSKMSFVFSSGYSLALIGAGYLIGLAGAFALLLGMFLAWGILVPYFTHGMDFSHAGLVSIATQVWKEKVRLIGTGTIAIAALWTLLQLSSAVFSGMRTLMSHAKNLSVHDSLDRTEQDLSFNKMMLLFVITVLCLGFTFYSFVQDSPLSLAYQLIFTLVGTVLVVLIGFFVAAACGYMAGLVGSSSSPISGIGLIAIIISSLIFLLIGQNLLTDPTVKKFAVALALFTTSVILATAAISNDNLQDLKTGQLVGASPWRQQVALLIGCIFGAIAIVPVLNLLYQAYGFVGALPRQGMDPSLALAAPQATLMATIAQGIFEHNIQWVYIIVGVIIGILVIVVDKILEKCHIGGLPPLAVGIGIYLPASVNMPLVLGGILAYVTKRLLTQRYAGQADASQKVTQHEQRGVLFASGLIVGESIIGVIIAAVTVWSVTHGGSESPFAVSESWINPSWLGLGIFVVSILIFISRVLKRN